MHGNLRKKFSCVEIVLRKGRQPDARRKLMPLLHEVAAFVNLSEKEPERNIVGDISFDARHLPGGFVEPDDSLYFCEDHSAAAGWFVAGIGIHAEFLKFTVAAHFVAQIGEQEGV